MATRKMARIINTFSSVRNISSSSIRLYSNNRLLNIKDDGPVRVIEINRPNVRNAINKETAKQLFDAFMELDKDSSILVGILAGNGGHFCAGYDLKELAQDKHQSVDFSVPYSSTTPAPMGPSRLFLSKPVIASLTGFTVAGGMELALWCDLRVAESDVTLGFYNRRFGVPLIDGGTVRLPSLIGLSRALDLILTGRSVTANEALNIGLVNRIVPVGEGLQESIKLAKHIAKFPQSCLRHDRQSAIHSSSTQDELLAHEYNSAVDLLKEAINGAQKFTDGEGRSGKLN